MPEKTNKPPVPAIAGHQANAVQLPLLSIKEVEIDGVGMGVLENGTPYLSLTGLARMCGIDHGSLSRLSNNWTKERGKERGRKIAEVMQAQGHNAVSLSLQTKVDGKATTAFVDTVCMAVLEYYAFDSKQGGSLVAVQNYRLLARSSIRQFIYNRCGYDPSERIPDSWGNFHARIVANDAVPIGYFLVFREIADIVIHMIQAGFDIDPKTVPDISVGQHWAKYWKANGFEATFGHRIRHVHDYPEWFPQAQSNPQKPWIYPVAALGEFRMWVYETYLPEKFPKYILGKTKEIGLPASQAELLMNAVAKSPKGLSGPTA